MRTVEDIIYQYCMGMLNPNPDYYAGRGNSVRDLNSSILEMLHGGIKTEIGEPAAKNFVNMVQELKNTNAESFLKELYQLEKKGWRAGPVMRVRVNTAPVITAAAAAPEKKDGAEQTGDGQPKAAAAPRARVVTEILNAFTRSGSLYGHDKEITQSFLDRHKAEIDHPAISGNQGDVSA